MAQRSDEEIQAEYDATLGALPALPVAKTDLVEMDHLVLEVALDQRELLQDLLAKQDDIIDKLDDIKEALSE